MKSEKYYFVSEKYSIKSEKYYFVSEKYSGKSEKYSKSEKY